MLNDIFSTFRQLGVFTLIPFIIYLIRKKTFKGFWDDLGLKKSNAKANLYGFLVFLVVGIPFIFLAIFNEEFMEIMTSPTSMTGKFRAMGFGVESVIILLFAAIIKTALAEEILFRGFLAKRLIAITNFQVGNILHAVIFGLIHTLFFLSISKNIFFLTAIFVFPALGAYLKVYINEKMANGSIIPGWIAHASGNLVSYSLFGFLL